MREKEKVLLHKEETLLSHRPDRWNHPYALLLFLYAAMLALAFAADSPANIARGLWLILSSRGVLITDYMAVGGMSATLVNAATVGAVSILLLYRARVSPNGSIIMALWLTTGFAMMGKNLFNMLPITLGVYLHARLMKEPFIKFTLVAMLAATVSPIVSGFSFHESLPLYVGLPMGVGLGVLAGFIFPAVSSFTVRGHGGYNLYNMGFAGGLISTFVVAAAEGFGLPMKRELWWSGEYTFILAVSLYILCAALIICSCRHERGWQLPELSAYRRFFTHSGRLVTDFYLLFGNTIYLNMGILGLVTTTLLLALGAELNGATLCGILTIMAFGAFGKQLKNVVPVLIGAVICTQLNRWDATEPANILAILFSTGLAPLAGHFGILFGIVCGFLHVNTIMHIGILNSGLNLYNNGYAAGFVVLLLLPLGQVFLKHHE